jgi:hypothetical protein
MLTWKTEARANQKKFADEMAAEPCLDHVAEACSLGSLIMTF